MTVNKRQHHRIEKRLTMQYCMADTFPKQWDMSMIENISLGGVKFASSYHSDLTHKIILLKIKLPELPRYLQLEAFVLSAKPRFSSKKVYDVRAKFININESSQQDLFLLDKAIKSHGSK